VKFDAVDNRPHWYVDAKWMFGSIFVFVFGLFLLSVGLFNLSTPTTGVNTLAKIVAVEFSRNGLDDSTEIQMLRDQLAASTNGTIKPIPTLNISISAKDLAGKTPREIRLMFFRQIALPIYNDGQGAENVLKDPAVKASFQGDTLLLRAVFSAHSHNVISVAMYVLGTISVLLLGLVIFFSFRLGRLANPGLQILVSSWLWALIFFITAKVAPTATLSLGFLGESAAYGGMVTPFIHEVVPDVANILLQPYLYASILGLGLLAIALVGKIIYSIVTKSSVAKS
jgi:hypothetical protein